MYVCLWRLYLKLIFVLPVYTDYNILDYHNYIFEYNLKSINEKIINIIYFCNLDLFYTKST